MTPTDFNRRPGTARRVRHGAVRWALAGVLAAARAGASVAAAENLLANPGFENGRTGWYSLAAEGNAAWREFSLTPAPEGPGTAARLDLSSAAGGGATAIWGTIQDLPDVRTLPARLKGRFRVESWRPGTEKQYVQVVLILWATRDYLGLGPAPKAAGGFVPLQIAFVLGGIAAPPFAIQNRKFVFLGPREPAVGRWQDFDVDLPAAFKTHWGLVPEAFKGLRLLCEVRYDGLRPAERAAAAVVYFDDLHLGGGR